ncbi:hypothetical protein [Roseospirillum parvum]|uniref:Dolichyl-phosphate-mannose-protein mannosyltransferase n=1 Tax=Roseospirillum parvum TaxID=83401 RepID=A0A1G8EGQ8_9PROT|nr:hypothetical protein [Roseospirillum parvum]SDH69041.1 hypothetical protein SAMN05421742_11034 [Roseospirillum parvum]
MTTSIAATAPAAQPLPMSARLAYELAVGLSVVAFVSLLGPWWQPYELDLDEGVNLMKAALVAGGYDLYGEIWSDQPPVLTWLLAPLFHLVEAPVAEARALIAGFAGLLAVCLFRILGRTEGAVAGLAAVALLLSGWLFQRLAVSVLVGLPALALGMLALDLALGPDPRGRRVPSPGRLAASAGVAALALGTKLFVGVLLPSLLLAVLLVHRPLGWRLAVARCGGWLAGLIAALAVLWLLSGAPLSQIVSPHLAASSGGLFGVGGGVDALWFKLGKEPQYLWLGGVGLVASLIGWRWSRLLPVLWLAVAGLALMDHQPLWYHHLLLLVVPLAWLGGLAVAPLAAAMASTTPRWRRLAGLAAGLAVVYALSQVAGPIASQIARTERDLVRPAGRADGKAVALLRTHSAPGQLVVTDRPMDAIRAGRLVPPALAVWTDKRRKTGQLSEADIQRIIEQTQPPVISLRRFNTSKDLRDWLENTHQTEYRQGNHLVFTR